MGREISTSFCPHTAYTSPKHNSGSRAFHPMLMNRRFGYGSEQNPKPHKPYSNSANCTESSGRRLPSSKSTKPPIPSNYRFPPTDLPGGEHPVGLARGGGCSLRGTIWWVSLMDEPTKLPSWTHEALVRLLDPPTLHHGSTRTHLSSSTFCRDSTSWICTGVGMSNQCLGIPLPRHDSTSHQAHAPLIHQQT